MNFLAAIRAVSFVGSDQAGKYIYERANRNGKRVQCNMGAKNHGVIMPDANKENTLNQLAGAACKWTNYFFLFLVFFSVVLSILSIFRIISEFYQCLTDIFSISIFFRDFYLFFAIF